jgi:hypothetical protein
VYPARTSERVYLLIKRVLNAVDVGSLNLCIKVLQIVSIGVAVVKNSLLIAVSSAVCQAIAELRRHKGKVSRIACSPLELAICINLYVKRYMSSKVTLELSVVSGSKRLISSGRKVRCVVGIVVARARVAGEGDFDSNST